MKGERLVDFRDARRDVETGVASWGVICGTREGHWCVGLQSERYEGGRVLLRSARLDSPLTFATLDAAFHHLQRLGLSQAVVGCP